MDKIVKTGIEREFFVQNNQKENITMEVGMTAAEKEKIRRMLTDLSGRRVDLFAVGERNRVTRAEGVLDGIYPEVFTVLVEHGGYSRRYCYTYGEVLTKHVRISGLR